MTYEDINKVIDNIAQKLGTSSEYLIAEYGKYQVGLGITRLIAGIIITIVACIVIVLSIKYADSNKYKFINNNEVSSGLIILSLIVIAIGIVLIMYGLMFIPWMISPTGATVHEILSKIR
jgi:hypothetical protein